MDVIHTLKTSQKRLTKLIMVCVAKTKRNRYWMEIVEWIRTFLTGRKPPVIVEGISSVRSDVISGILGPILFLIHIGDIDGELRYTTASFLAICDENMDC